MESIDRLILQVTGNDTIIDKEHIQTLWKGYGSIERVKLEGTSIICKCIRFPENPHPRKVKSYQVENYWYENYKSEIKDAYIPKMIYADEGILLIEDLRDKGFHPKNHISWNEVKLCIKWLANFHKYYLNTTPKGLWEVGTYWHLRTRQDELQRIQSKDILELAAPIDQKLNKAKYKTLVHGDAKLANFLFNDSETAAVDFQYIGAGVGVKDLAYFLSSIYNEDELYKKEEECLDYYFKILNDQQVENEWRELYPYAWADFYRFLAGWNPQHYKVHSYSKSMWQKVKNEFN